MANKRGQYASNAAAFIAVLTVAIILYILFLPPDIRTELLGDQNGNINGTGSAASAAVRSEAGLLKYVCEAASAPYAFSPKGISFKYQSKIWSLEYFCSSSMLSTISLIFLETLFWFVR